MESLRPTARKAPHQGAPHLDDGLRTQAERLIRRHQDPVRAYLSFLGCPPSRLDDLVQDVFVALLSTAFEDRGYAPTASYLRKVARSLFLKSLQRAGRQPLLVDWADAEQAWMEFEREDAGEGYLDALRQCLGRIGGRAAQVLNLRYAEKLRRSHIAEHLGLTESGVKSLLVRSRRLLRICIERRTTA